MALTERQRQRVTRYLRDVQEHLEGADDHARRQAERAIRRRIDEEIERLGNGVPKDEEVESVLASLGPPSSQAALHRPGTDAAIAPWGPIKQDRRWLGVCGGIAREFEVDPLLVRAIVLVLGAISLPFSLWIYLGAYGVMGFAMQPPSARERIDPLAIAKAVWPVALFTLIIHLAVTYAIDGVDWLLANFTAVNLLVLDSRWTWYADGAFGTFFWAILFVLPLAALSALPVREDWKPTFKKLAQASVAVYSVYAAYGLGSVVAGVAMHLATRYEGPVLSEIVQNLALPF